MVEPIVITNLKNIKKVITFYGKSIVAGFLTLWGVKDLICLYVLFIFYIRSFFRKENPDLFYYIGIIIIMTRFFFPGFIEAFSLFVFWIYIGFTLIIYDSLGSYFSSFILDEPLHFLTTFFTIRLKGYTNPFIRHITTRAALGLVIGTTPMTATGRAALIAGGLTGGSWLINEELNRRLLVTIEEKKLFVEQQKVTLEEKKFALDQQKFAFEQKKYADQLAAVQKSGWGWWPGQRK